MLVVLEVRMVALHAAETMVAMTVIVNVMSVGGRVVVGSGGWCAHAAEWDFNRGRKRLQPPSSAPARPSASSVSGEGVFDMSRISS